MFWRRNATAADWARFWDEWCERDGAERIDWVLLHHFHYRKIVLGDALVRLRKIYPHVRIATSLVESMIRIWNDFDASRFASGTAFIPELPFVLPECSGPANAHLFVRNWLG